MNKKITQLIALSLLTVNICLLQGQSVSIETILDTNSIELGRRAVLSYKITASSGSELQIPVFTDTLITGVELLGRPVLDTVITKNGDLQVVQKLSLTSFDEGKYYIKPQPFVLMTGSVSDTFYSKASYLDVLGVELDSAGVVRDIKDVEHVKRTFKDFLPLIIILLIVGLIAVFVFVLLPRLKKKSNEEEAETIEPPHVIALRELDRLKAQKLWQQEQLKEYYSRLTAIIRKYLENQFSVKAMEETTSEILQDIRLRGLDSKLNMNNLEDLLNLADLVKFAKGTTNPEENLEQLDIAYKLVKDTYEININKHSNISVKDDDEFMKFVFSGIDLAVETTKERGKAVIPFVMIMKGEDQRLQRFDSETYNDSVKLAENHIRKLTPKPDYALLVYDGVLSIEGRKNEAIYVKAYDKKEQKGLVMAQRYQPNTDDLDFQLINKPALISKEENVLRQIDLDK